MKTVIIGIDPGTQKTGFGILRLEVDGGAPTITHVNHGTIVLSDGSDLPARLLGIGDSLAQLFGTYEPTVAVVEKIFLGKNVDSAFKLGHARGVVFCEAARRGIQIEEYATREVKKGVTGNGGADKEQVQTALLQQLHIQKIVNYDASDALALAYHHCQQLIAAARMKDQAR